MKQKRIIIGWALATTTFALFGCNQENPYGPEPTAHEEALNLCAPSGEYIAKNVRELKKLMEPHVESNQRESKDFEIDEIKYYPQEKGYLAEVIYTTEDGYSSNVVIEKGPIRHRIRKRGESGGGIGTSFYSCKENDSGKCSSCRLVVDQRAKQRYCVCDKGISEGCSLYKTTY